MLAIDKIKQNEKEFKKDIFDIDLAIDVDSKFQEYKKLVYETTMLVDRFWNKLSSKDYIILELINLGTNIVDHYLDTKEYFD